jgi:hypothetical protein
MKYLLLILLLILVIISLKPSYTTLDLHKALQSGGLTLDR